jgi:hypothetical protein
MRVAIVVLCLTAMLTGCADSGDPQPGRVRSEAATPAGYGTLVPPNKLGLRSLYERRVDIIALISPYYPMGVRAPVTGESDFDWWMATVDKDLDTERQLKVRNTVAQAIVDASTRNCDAYLNSLRGDQVANRTLSDILATGFGIAGGLTDPVRNAKILSSLGGFSTAFGASIDRNIFAQQAVELIADQVKKYRAAERTTIEGKYSRSYSDWSLEQAMADVVEYHADCSLMKGLVLTQDSLTKREALVEAARAAAAKAAKGGSSGSTVSDIVDAIVGAGSDQAPAPPPAQSAAPLANSSTELPTTDLDAQIKVLSDCLDLIQRQITAGASVDTFLKNEPAFAHTDGKCHGDLTWKGQFLALLQQHLSSNDLTNGTVDEKSAAFDSERSAIMNEVNARRAQIVSLRNNAMDYIAYLGKSDGHTAADIRNAIAQLGTPSVVANDPVFKAMTQAASASLDPAVDSLRAAELSAALAQAAARAYEASVPSKAAS